MHVGVAADHHLWRRPFRHEAVRVRLELGAAEIDVDDVAVIQFRQ
jgi:hypothetical protein